MKDQLRKSVEHEAPVDPVELDRQSVDSNVVRLGQLALDGGETMTTPSRTAESRKAANSSRRRPAVMDYAPRVEMGGRSVAIVGGNVSTIPAPEHGEPEEVPYEKGQPTNR